MRGLARRRWLLVVIALAGLLAGLAPTLTSADGLTPVAAWCFVPEQGRWLGYSEGVPGSATQEDFTACLSAAAERGEIRSLKGELLDRGMLIDAGDDSIVWPVRRSSLYINSYDDRIVVKDSCDRAFEVRNGSTSIVENGYPCLGPGRSYEVDRSVTYADFTIYLVSRSLVIDGEDDWFHIGYAPASPDRADPSRWGQLTLLGRHPGLWLRQETFIDGPTYNYGRIFYHPVAGTGPEVARHRFGDWLHTVRSELILSRPAVRSFEDSGRDHLPDREAYAQAAQTWVTAILEDLFSGRVQSVSVVMPEGGGDWLDINQRTLSVGFPGTSRILLQLTELFVHPDSRHSPRGTATFLMLLERYFPEFDSEFARELAKQYQVPVGDPIEVEPVSSRTQDVRELLLKKAPLLPSDNEPIPPELLLSSVTFEVGQVLKSSRDGRVWERPACEVRFRDLEGNVTTSGVGVNGEFTVGAGRSWNGLEVGSASGRTTDSLHVNGTPRAAGRVRMAVTSMCSDDQYHEPRLLGYSEIIIEDQRSSE